VSAAVPWSGSRDLGIRAWCWSLVTVPAVGFVAIIVSTAWTIATGVVRLTDVGAVIGGIVLALLFLDLMTIFLAFGSALVALPLTHLLEIALRRVPDARTRAVLHACLAGVLACVPATFGTEGFSLAWLAPLAVAAGTAAALAVRGAERRHRIDGLEARLGPAADGTTPGREIPTGPAPSLQTGELP
jgi:hypothetical protein